MPQVVFGGMPAWLLEDYLIELGGARTPDESAVTGDGWRATLTPAPTTPPAIARITVTIDGERGADILEQLRVKARRGGG